MFCRDVPTRLRGCDAVSQAVRVLIITFLESAATIFIERGLYFYTHERLAFTGAENLGLALAWGVAYVVGAQLSQGVSRPLSEKGLLALTLVGQVLGHAVLCVWAGPHTVVAMTMAIGCITGVKWPLVESYVAAGRTPAVNVWETVRYMAPGVMAHKSALKDGEILDVPDWGDAPT